MEDCSEATLELADGIHGDLQELICREFLEHHSAEIARINNGSFGSCPASVLASQERWYATWLRQPDEFYFGPLENGIRASRESVSSMINSPNVEQVVLIDNVTAAVCMVLQKVAWDFIEGRYEKGDSILSMNFSYGAVKKAIKAYLLRTGAHLIEVKLPFPVSSSAEIISSVESALQRAQNESRNIRFAMFDHITSVPTIVLPVRELVDRCRKAGIDQILVDGAHAPGNLNIDVQAIDADYYTGNLHKWAFAPTSVAFLYTKSKHLSDLHHPIVSHNYQNGLSNECAWIGTRDYSAHLAVVDAVKFFKNFKGGMQAVLGYNHSKVVSISSMLAKAWGTKCGTPPNMCSSMIMVGLPNSLSVHSHGDALNLRTKLREEFGVEVPVYYAVEGLEMLNSSEVVPPLTAYLRISHQIYNNIEEYIRLRDAVNFLVSR